MEQAIVSIRMAVFEDFAAIARFHADSWSKHYRGILSDAYLDSDNYAERGEVWRKRSIDPLPNQLTIVAYIGDRLVGFCCALIEEDAVFGTLIDNLHVAPDQQGQGLGRKLLAEVHRHLSDRSASKRVYLWVYEQNHRARQAYQGLGGHTHETVEKEDFDGDMKRICRITWNDSSVFSRE